MPPTPKPKHAGGRPTNYTPELAARICTELTTPKTLLQISQEDWAPCRQTVYRWLVSHVEFSDMYARARELQADAFVDMIISIAFDSQGDSLVDEFGNAKQNHEYVNRSRLKIDALKWHASKTAPKKYGDKPDASEVAEYLAVFKRATALDANA